MRDGSPSGSGAPRPDPALEAAYRATAYLVHLPGSRPVAIRIGAPLPDTLALLAKDAPWAFLTAWNPGSVPHPRAANEAAMLSLLAELRLEARLRLWHGTGQPDGSAGSPWHPEPSVWVVGLQRAEAVLLAARYGQRAIVAGNPGDPARLLWCQ